MIRLLIALLAIAPPSFAAISINTVWEVRASVGNDTNGGGFVAGASGTDYSQNNNKNATACTNCGSSTVNLSTTDAVAVGTTTITSITASFSAAIVGNIINLSGGTGSLASGWYQVTTFTNSTTIVVDRTVATGTGITMNIGGAIASWAQLFTNMQAFNSAWVKNTANYTFTTAQTINLNCTNNGTTASNVCNIQGYGTTRGDTGKATVTTATNSTILFNCNGCKGITFQNFTWSNTASTRAAGINAQSQSWSVSFINMVFDGFTSAILGNFNTQDTFANLVVISSEIKNCTSTSGAVFNTNGGTFKYDYFHNNVVGFQRAENSCCSNAQIFQYCVFANNSDTGITVSSGAVGSVVQVYLFLIDHCVFYNQTNSGLLVGDGSIEPAITNTIFVNNGRYGWEVVVAISNNPPYTVLNGPNFYFGNTLAARLNVGAGTGDVTGTAVPFTNAGSNDFSLNSTAGGGAACKGVGFPGATGLFGTGFADIGALQSQGTTTVSGGPYVFTSGQ